MLYTFSTETFIERKPDIPEGTKYKILPDGTPIDENGTRLKYTDVNIELKQAEKIMLISLVEYAYKYCIGTVRDVKDIINIQTVIDNSEESVEFTSREIALLNKAFFSMGEKKPVIWFKYCRKIIEFLFSKDI